METIEDFGNQLIETLDLDPVYVVLDRSSLSVLKKLTWLLGYWCFYHSGVACRLVEAEDFYEEFEKAIVEKWPRGRERRYFYGKSARKTLEFLSSNPPELWGLGLLELGEGGRGVSFSEIRSEVSAWVGFGDWMVFKVADMMERLFGLPVEFENNVLDLYRVPAEGVALVAREKKLSSEQTVGYLLDCFRRYEAPPRFDRVCGIQEVETILCKYKSFRGGHYRVGQDVNELVEALEDPFWGSKAKEMFEVTRELWGGGR